MEVVRSADSDAVLVSVEPGWARNLRPKPMEEFVGSDLKIGAAVHSELGSMLLLRVDDICGIVGAELMLGVDAPIALHRYGKTEVALAHETRHDVTHSTAAFLISDENLRRMASGEGLAWVRAHTSKGVIEANFGATCGSQWAHHACGAVSRAIKRAKETGLIE